MTHPRRGHRAWVWVQQAGLFPDLPLTGARKLDLTRAYTRAFLDQHLRGRPQYLLTGPSPANPEITFH